MKYRTRIYYTEAQKTLMWDRWQKGGSLSSIARLFDRHHSSVGGILKQTGGIPAAAAPTIATGADVIGARGNLARCGGRRLDPFDCPNAASRTVHGQSRDPAERRPATLPWQPGRSSGLGAGVPPQDL